MVGRYVFSIHLNATNTPEYQTLTRKIDAPDHIPDMADSVTQMWRFFDENESLMEDVADELILQNFKKVCRVEFAQKITN